MKRMRRRELTRRECLRAVPAGIGMLIATRVLAQTPTPAAQPEPAVTGFICPMHPNEIKGEPGNCSICGMKLVPGDPAATADYIVKVTTEPKLIRAGQKTRFQFTIVHPVTGVRVDQFADVHDKLFHLFVVSRDLEEFAHIHPEHLADGSFAIEHTLPKAGHYMLFFDFMPIGGGPQLLTSPLVTAGFDGDIASAAPNLKEDESFVKTVDGVKLELVTERRKIIAGEESDMAIHFEDAATGQPVTNLQRYLGAFGHAMMLSEDMQEYVHAHPAETLEGTSITSGGGPDLTFHALFPKPGHYKIWLQFQRAGTLSTVPITVRVLRLGETA